MGDRQQWMFPLPPAPGVDPDYDALIRVHRESEDADDERRIELAMAILLLSRNYDPKPEEYRSIFSFGNDELAHSTARAAISELVRHDLGKQQVNRRPAQTQSTPPHFHTHFRCVRTLVRSCTARVCSTMAHRRGQPGDRR
jgi:hypothetical protein